MIKTKTLPVPGSLEAIEKGCLCEVEIDPETNRECYIINHKCPVHGIMSGHIKKTNLNNIILKKIEAIEAHIFKLVCYISFLVFLILVLVLNKN